MARIFSTLFLYVFKAICFSFFQSAMHYRIIKSVFRKVCQDLRGPNYCFNIWGIFPAFEVTALASSSGVVNSVEKLHDLEDFQRNCKNASGVTAAAICYLQFGKIFREIENLIGDFMVLILRNFNKFSKVCLVKVRQYVCKRP